MNYKEELERLLENSYSPYSNYKVSAIVVTKDGKTFSGVNIENANYGNSVCAERNAIHNAVTVGYKPGEFKELYFMSKGAFSSPCGACLQTMAEFFDEDTKIIFISQEGEVKEFVFSELLPYPFTNEDLK
jgi:cytidine deaminase